MPDRKTLEALLVRVEGAGGEARSLDEAIFRALVDPLKERNYWQWRGMQPRGNQDPPSAYWSSERNVPRVTSSIDAALALTERLLPDRALDCLQHLREGYWNVALRDDRGRGTPRRVWHDGKTAPLAILAALLTALMQTQDENV